MNGANIVIVGAGKGGYEVLKVLTSTPNVTIKYVCDLDPHARGVLFAIEHQIPCVRRLSEFIDDPTIDLIFEVTGREEVFEELSRRKRPSVSLVGSAGTKAIFSLLDSYTEINRKLQSYRLNLEHRIIERTEELEKLNMALEKEKAATEKLYEAQQQVTEEKTKYLLHTTHQLKAPFAAIQNYVDIILEGYTGEIPERTRDIMFKIRRRCELLSETIKDMLELSNLKSHVVNDVTKVPVDVREVIREVIERFGVGAAAKRLRIAGEVEGLPLMVSSSHRHLFDLISVFVDNAIKYSRPEGSIEITAAQTGPRKARIAVRDHGIGIAPESLPKIFTEYFRANNAVRHDDYGNGLGLAIARELARHLEAEIQVESTLHEGSVFSVAL
jgi:signal transduction histidine kinase